MNQMCRWLTDLVSRLLEPDDRTAVLGDFAESGEAAWQALCGVAGLVVRRQSELWKHGGPWIAPVSLVAPLVILFLTPAFRTISWIGQQVVTFWHMGVRYETGLPAGQDTIRMVCSILLVIVWAWSGGFGLGLLAHRTAWQHPVVLASLFLFLLRIMESTSAPPLALVWFTVWTSLVFAPFLLGVWRGSRSLEPGPIWRIAAAMVILTAAIQTVDAQRMYARFLWPASVLPFAAILWQYALLFTAAKRRRPIGVE